MGQFEMKLPDDFVKMLSEHLADVDKYAPKMLEEGSKVVESAVKSAMPSNIAKYAGKVKAKKPKKAKNGGWVCPITISGKTEHTGIPVMTLAAYYDYGTKRIPKTAWMRNAVASATNEAVAKMTKVFEEESGK